MISFTDETKILAANPSYLDDLKAHNLKSAEITGRIAEAHAKLLGAAETIVNAPGDQRRDYAILKQRVDACLVVLAERSEHIDAWNRKMADALPTVKS